MNQNKILRNFTCVCGTLPRVEVVKKRYTSGELALYIEIGSAELRETLMIASCWVPGIPDGCVAIKDHGENRGCLAALTNAGVIDDPHGFIDDIPICRVLF